MLDSLAFLALSRILTGPVLWAELKASRWRVLVSGFLVLLSFCVFLWALSRSATRNSSPAAKLRGKYGEAGMGAGCKEILISSAPRPAFGR